MPRNGLTLALAILFALGAVVSAFEREWVGAAAAALVAVLSLAVACRRGRTQA